MLCLDVIAACRGSLTERKAHIYTNASSVSTERQLMPAVRPSNFWLARVLQAASCDSGQSSNRLQESTTPGGASPNCTATTPTQLNSAFRIRAGKHKRESIELKLGKGRAQ